VLAIRGRQLTGPDDRSALAVALRPERPALAHPGAPRSWPPASYAGWR